MSERKTQSSELFEERAAIMQYDGNMTKEQAEREARKDQQINKEKHENHQ